LRPSFFFQAEDGIRDGHVTGVQTCALPILTLGQIFYVTKDLEQAALKARVDEALTTFRRAEGQLRALEPPPSLRGAHDDYTAAVSLFERGAIEVLKMFDDGRDEHMRIAQPLGQQAADKIREVGVKFWPHEFPPN